MGDRANMQQLPEATKKRIEWMKLMEKIIDPLHNEIKEQTKQRQKSYRQILGYLAEARRKSDPHYSQAEGEAGKYIKANWKWIALTEIDKQCRKIETDVSFRTEKETQSDAVARVIYASQYCENKLPKELPKELTDKLAEVRKMLAREICGRSFELEANKGAERRTYKIQNKLEENTKVTPEEIVKKLAEVNNMKIPS